MLIFKNWFWFGSHLYNFNSHQFEKTYLSKNFCFFSKRNYSKFGFWKITYLAWKVFKMQHFLWKCLWKLKNSSFFKAKKHYFFKLWWQFLFSMEIFAKKNLKFVTFFNFHMAWSDGDAHLCLYLLNRQVRQCFCLPSPLPPPWPCTVQTTHKPCSQSQTLS